MTNELYRSTASVEHLRFRAEMLQRLRRFFDSHGLIEVQTPVLSRHTVIDRHIDLIEVAINPTSSESSARWFLQSSPEAAMKRLLVCGLERIYQIGPVFRADEVGRLHNPEFTLAEWYRVGDDLNAGLTFLESLTHAMLGTTRCDRLRFSEAFQRTIGIDVLNASVDELADVAMARRLAEYRSWSNDWDDWVNLLFSMVVQPSLGNAVPEIVTHFPASQAALARLDVSDARVADRFELFYQGVELANGYHELLDADVLRQRNAKANEDRQRDGKPALPLESYLLDAMDAGMPSATGCALGFDRLVMVAIGAQNLSDVVAFPFDRA